jgi:hypothetical protein
MLAGTRRGDWAHLALMIAAFGLAYAMPFELLILARAVLGPAHYATEISWLHDRGYFLKRRDIAAALAVVAVGVALINNASWFGFAIWAAFAVGAAAAATRSSTQTALLLIAATGLTAIMFIKWPALSVMGGLLTTVVHASLFTLIFMGLGAWHARSRFQAALIGAYIAAIALIVMFPPSETPANPAFTAVAHQYFDGIGDQLGMLFGTGKISLDRLIGLLAFVYTYHYLNWFIKAEVIRWATIPPMRWAAIGIVSVGSTGLYFYDFALGFSVLLALSLMHVVLEFPLDALAARQLGEAIAGSLSAHARQRQFAVRRG